MKIKFYGATWCRDCRLVKNYFDDTKIEYEYINIDEVEGAADEVIRINKGLQSIPTLIFPNGELLVEPKIEDLKTVLKNNNIL